MLILAASIANVLANTIHNFVFPSLLIQPMVVRYMFYHEWARIGQSLGIIAMLCATYCAEEWCLIVLCADFRKKIAAQFCGIWWMLKWLLMRRENGIKIGPQKMETEFKKNVKNPHLKVIDVHGGIAKK